MELIKRVEEADFSQRLRGYDMDEVDQFLESMAKEIGRLEHQLAAAHAQLEARLATEPAGQAPPAEVAPAEPARAREGSATLHDPDGAVQRMLAIAQRTADEAVRDAKAEANRVVSEAEIRANSTVAGAEEQRDAILAEAANEARRVAEATRRPLVEEIAALEGSRDSLERDVSLLERHLAQQRTQLSASVQRLQQLLDDPESFKIDKAPDTSGVVLPDQFRSLSESAAPVSDMGIDDPRAVAVGEAEADLEAIDAGGLATEPADDEPTSDEPASDETPFTETPSGEAATDESETGEPPADQPAPGWPVAEVTDLAAARSEVVVEAGAPLPEPEPVAVPLTAVPPLPDRSPLDGLAPPPEVAPAPPMMGMPSDTPDTDGPPTAEVPLIDELIGDESGGDQFLEDLRRASEEADLGPSEGEADEAMAAFFDQDDEEGRRPRFGRRS